MNPKIFLLMGFLAMALACLGIISVIPGGLLNDLIKVILMAVAMLFVVVAFSSRYYSYLLFPFINQRRKHIILSDQPPYYLASTGDAIITKRGTDFVATTYIQIPIYISGSEMTDEERSRFSNQISRLVSVSKDPVRFSTELRAMDKDGYLRIIKDSISEAENEVSQLTKTSNPAAIERGRGKLAMWKNMLDHISAKSSMELVTFCAISAIGSREYEAISIAQQKSRELMNGIGTILGVTPNIVVGNEVLKLVEPEYLIPLSTVSEEISKKIERGEVE